jgi:hypothetical protein
VRPSAPVVLFGLLLLALVVATALVVAPAGADLPELSVRSTAPTGGRALALWLESLGYGVEEATDEPFAIPEGAAALFVLEPESGFDAAAVDRVTDWVDGGGRLFIAASSPGPRRLLDRFGFSLRFAGDRQAEAVPVQPLFLAAPVERLVVDAWDSLEAREGLAPWLATGDRVYLGSRRYGRGSVTVLSATYPLSNAGLAVADNAALVLNVVGQLPAGARIAFDEYHHGFGQQRATGLWQLLLEHTWGWAVIYAVALGYAYLWLRGRRFGPALAAVPPPRRSVSEYVASLATLYRRAGQRAYVADRLADQLKRDLATALGLSPRLPDPAFAEAVGRRRATDAAPLAAVLARLRDGQALGEDQLLALAREADDLRARLLRRGP